MGHSRETRTVFVPTSQIKKSAGKTKRDPNAPKKRASAYSRFAKTRRVGIKKEHPTAQIGDISKKLGEEWKSLSDEKKTPFIKEAEKDNAVYQKKMDTYKGRNPDPKKRKDMTEAELGYVAAADAIKDFIEDGEIDMCMSSYSCDVYDRVQPPSAAHLTYMPLTPRATAEKTLEHLENSSTKKSREWLEKSYKNSARDYIEAYRGECSGVIIPLSKAEEKKRRESWTTHPRGKHFIVSFDYHH